MRHIMTKTGSELLPSAVPELGQALSTVFSGARVLGTRAGGWTGAIRAVSRGNRRLGVRSDTRHH